MAATRSSLPKSPFFKLVAAGEGIWAAVATDFTAAVGNSAIVDLGGRWLVVDTFMSARAATDLHEVVRSLASMVAKWWSLVVKWGSCWWSRWWSRPATIASSSQAAGFGSCTATVRVRIRGSVVPLSRRPGKGAVQGWTAAN